MRSQCFLWTEMFGYASDRKQFRAFIAVTFWAKHLRSKYKFSSYLVKDWIIFCWCVCVCLCVCVCVYILPPWRLLPTVRCPRHAWELRINDLVLWIFIWVLLPSSFISVFKSTLFHLQRRNSSPPKNTGEKTIWYTVLLRKDDIYRYRI